MTLPDQVTSLESEKWIPIKGYEGLYEVSTHGNVRSIKRSGSKGGISKIFDDRGYDRVYLSKNGKMKQFILHRLVAIAFISNLENKEQVNHKDGNKQNNFVHNLEWVTRKENELHKRNVLGEDSKGSKNGNFGHRRTKNYPCEKTRNKLCALGVPRNKHNLAELGELLPNNTYNFRVDTITGMKWLCRVRLVAINHTHDEVENTEVEARAAMLCYLLENNLMKIGE